MPVQELYMKSAHKEKHQGWISRMYLFCNFTANIGETKEVMVINLQFTLQFISKFGVQVDPVSAESTYLHPYFCSTDINENCNQKVMQLGTCISVIRNTIWQEKSDQTYSFAFLRSVTLVFSPPFCKWHHKP